MKLDFSGLTQSYLKLPVPGVQRVQSAADQGPARGYAYGEPGQRGMGAGVPGVLGAPRHVGSFPSNPERGHAGQSVDTIMLPAFMSLDRPGLEALAASGQDGHAGQTKGGEPVANHVACRFCETELQSELTDDWITAEHGSGATTDGATDNPRTCWCCDHLYRPGLSRGYCGGRDDLPAAYGDNHPLRKLPEDCGATCAWWDPRYRDYGPVG